jgi:hypothetical protein
MLVIIFAIIFHMYANFITHDRILNNNISQLPLYDIIHNHTYDLGKYKYIPDYIAIIFFLPLLMSDNYNTIKYFLNIAAVISILRSCTILVTDLPKSDINCNNDKLSSYNMVFGHCYDKIFSGHVAYTLLALLVARSYNILDNDQTIIFMLLHIIYSLFIIISRCHYTVDVLLSYFITIPLFFAIKYFYAANGLQAS